MATKIEKRGGDMELYPGNKRYHTLDYHLKSLFGTKVVKVALNAGFSCPNIDGTLSYGGCSYCSSSGSGDFAGSPKESLADQFKSGIQILSRKWPSAKYIPYFQAHTNTYAPLTVLRQKYEETLSFPNVVGLSIATRPDCLPDEVLDYLSELNQRTYLSVELGLQTIWDKTACAINRGYEYPVFEEAVKKLNSRHIRTCVHIINGLPGESIDQMRKTVKRISALPISAIKIHMLYLQKGTRLAQSYEKEPFPMISMEEYIHLICDQIELLPPNVVVERVTGDGAQDLLLAPIWSKNKKAVRNGIDKELKRRNSFQGKNYKETQTF